MTDCYSKSKDERADDAHAMPHAPFRCKGMIGMGFDPFKQVAVARYFLKACLPCVHGCVDAWLAISDVNQ